MDKGLTNKSGGEEEFSFVEDHEAPSYEPSSPKPETVVSGPRKKIFVLIGVIVALFCLYKLYGLFSTTSSKAPAPAVSAVTAPRATSPVTSKPVVKTTAVQSQATIIAPPIPASQTLPVPPIVAEKTTNSAVSESTTIPASNPETSAAILGVSSPQAAAAQASINAPTTEAVPEAVAANEDIKNLITTETEKTNNSSDGSQVTSDKLNKLEQAISENGEASENLQQQIGGLTNAISGIQDNIAQLTQQINTLSEQIKKPRSMSTPTPVAIVHKPKVVKRAKPKTSVYVPSAINGRQPTITAYFVKAMIQGRAWLISPDGATFTIGSGDNLPGYGQVLSINPDRGVVMTSSGRVINYMPQDR
jgi:hypothetical protein